MPAADMFSDDYGQARDKFLSAARATGCALAHYENPHARGPDGERLYMDTAWLGPRAAGLVLLNISGTHGVEGYAGSAAQTAWLGARGMRPLPRDVALLFVHALNPFGFAWNLRGNEDNVDINRNWIDFDAAAPDNALYGKLHDVLCPARIDRRSLNAAAGAYGVLAERHGTWRMDDALTRGQYAHADGIHFGGHAPSWSRRILHGTLPGMLRHVRQVALIDWHSGPVGDGELIFLCYSAPGTPAYQTAQSWWGRDSLDPEAIDRLWSGGRPSRHGLVFDGITRLLGRTALAGGVVEFCSARQQTGPAGALRVSMLERWLRFEGGQTSPEAKKFRKEIRSNYAPARASFREKAIDNALHVFDITLSGLAAQAGGEIRYSG